MVGRPLAALAIVAALSATHCDRDEAAPSLASSAPMADGSAAPSGAASAEAPHEAEWSPTGPPVVDLHGDARVPSPPSPNVPRLASRAMLTRVHKKPDHKAPVIGFLRAGAIVAMASTPAGKAGCPNGWRAIEPYGYVCPNEDATVDLEDPIVRASTRRPDLAHRLPYLYGVVMRGGPAYARIPTEDDLARFEPNLKTHFAKWAKDEENGASYGLDLWLRWHQGPPPPLALDALERKVTDEAIPWYLKDGATVPNLSRLVTRENPVKIDELNRRNGVAFVESFLHEGRRYNVSTDLRVMPADRFRPIRGSDFHGYEIGKDIDFPFALVRKKGGKKWKFDGAKPVADGELEWRSAVALTGKQRFHGNVLHYETKDGFWVDDRHAGRVDPAKKMPAWGKNGERWIDVNVTKQVLVAYEGTKAVFATLVSTGEHGLGNHETTRSTKRGIFRIHTKHITTTMNSDTVGEEFELRDVPYVMFFEGGYALHGAYWHDGFGQPKSHGCINLAPEDARRLFWWTEPPVPPGWHGVARPLTGTVVFVHP